MWMGKLTRVQFEIWAVFKEIRYVGFMAATVVNI